MKNEKETKNPAVNAGYAEKDISVNAEIARDNEAHHVFDELSKKIEAPKELKNLDRTENKENNMLVDAESAYANAVKSETEKLAKDFSDMKNKANLKRAHK